MFIIILVSFADVGCNSRSRLAVVFLLVQGYQHFVYVFDQIGSRLKRNPYCGFTASFSVYYLSEVCVEVAIFCFLL